MRKYYSYYVKKALTITNLVTIEHMVLPPDFSYPEESHLFHEFVYVDNGCLSFHTEKEQTLLKQGDCYLLAPGEKHYHTSFSEQSATVLFVCFKCKSDFTGIIYGKSTLNKEMKKMIIDILTEAKNAFRFPFDKKLVPLEKPTFGSQQLIENHIEALLIRLIRQRINENADIKFVMNSVEFENSLVNDIIQILKDNLYGNINLDLISEKTFYSKTYINNIFKKNLGYSIIQYYNRLKIQKAKSLLRENMPTAAIADALHFESPNYFTKVFKKYTGMTPSQYKKTSLQ